LQIRLFVEHVETLCWPLPSLESAARSYRAYHPGSSRRGR